MMLLSVKVNYDEHISLAREDGFNGAHRDSNKARASPLLEDMRFLIKCEYPRKYMVKSGFLDVLKVA
jgi:hypothetical protein